MTTIIYHNPNCSNSRKALSLIEASGVVPEVVLYLNAALNRDALKELFTTMNIKPRAVMREKEVVFLTLGLDDLTLSDDALIDAIVAHPTLLQRPIVVTAKGAAICRPPELVLALLPS